MPAVLSRATGVGTGREENIDSAVRSVDIKIKQSQAECIKLFEFRASLELMFGVLGGK